jgi:hypothetical protein
MRTISIALYAAWLGASLLFAAVVAPAAFAVLPDRALAGAVVGRVLPVIFFSGLFLSAADLTREQATTRTPRRLLPSLIVFLACAAAQFLIAPRIHRLRGAIGPSLDALGATDPQRVAFGRLHAISVVLLGVAMIAALIAVVLAARTRLPNEARVASSRSPSVVT